jgi:hypothetical protein
VGKFAELDGPNPLVKGLGPEAAAELGAKLSSMDNAEFILYNYLPELSLQQQPPRQRKRLRKSRVLPHDDGKRAPVGDTSRPRVREARQLLLAPLGARI